jgi:hypothetical protein
MERQGTDANLKEKSKCEALSSNPGQGEREFIFFIIFFTISMGLVKLI